jgi:hypothetical protein
VKSESRYLFWAKVLKEYYGGPRSLDVHALEAIPGILRVAEASFGWNLVVQFLLLFLMVAPAWGAYEVELTYIPSLGARSGPSTPLGSAFFLGVLLVTATIVAVNSFGSRRTLGRFILSGAFDHSRRVRSLAVLQVEAMRTPRSWRLRCRAGEQDVTVVVSARRDRLRTALELAGQPLETVLR